MRAPWARGSDVMLVVTGKYTLLGATVGREYEDGRVVVQWEDRTRSTIRGDLLVTPGGAAILKGSQVAQLTGERDRARELAAKLEEQLARIDEIVGERVDVGFSAFGRVIQIRDILGTTVRS